MKLSDQPITTILPVTDTDRARSFYQDRLGLPFQGADSEGKPMFGLAGGATLALIEKPPGAQGQHTALSFEVTGLEAAIAELSQAGVEFADYDLPGLRTVDHVFSMGQEKAAWFSDPDGNILCLHEVTGARQ
jgi:catechol 2,3-dioxygenase-like lactoylglutathione lyase family enzyme